MKVDERRTGATAAALVLPLALAQFICSYAATNMNVAISTIAADLGVDVIAIQTTITLFTLTMASLMIPGSKVSDIFGRKACFLAGLGVYGTGALLAALTPGIGLLMVGYSLLEGVGSALLIPPIYILVTVSFPDVQTRARWFGVVSAAAGLGAAAGPLIGGLITSFIGWRVSFVVQVLAVALIFVLALRIVDPPRTADRPRFDLLGAVLSAAGLFFVVFGILRTSTYGWLRSREDWVVGDRVVIPAGGLSPVWVAIALGAVILVAFILHLRARERAGKDPLFSLRLFGQRTSNLGLVTQVVQWLSMQGSFFVLSVYLQQVWHYNAIQTGLMLMPATIGILAASAAAQRMARRRPQRTLVVAGFVATLVGMILLLALVRDGARIVSFVPGLLLIGLGVGVMLTASVNLVQSSWPERDQGDISGISRSASNLGSSLGTALAGSVVAASTLSGLTGGAPFAASLATMIGATAIGLAAAWLIRSPQPAATPTEAASV